MLAVGVQPNSDAGALFPDGSLSLDEFRYVAEPNEDVDPGRTSIPGVYVAGSASGVKDMRIGTSPSSPRPGLRAASLAKA